MKQKTIYYTIGLPASGKTTWAYQKQAELREKGVEACLVSMDSIRTLYNLPFTKDTEFLCRRLWMHAIQTALILGRDVIIHDTNFNPIWLERINEIATKHDAKQIQKSFLDVPLDECIRRNALRHDYEKVPTAAIAKMHEKWILNKEFSTREALKKRQEN